MTVTRAAGGAPRPGPFTGKNLVIAAGAAGMIIAGLSESES
jgi:hypothetical protein